MAIIPPWLNIGPDTFLNAARSGGQLGAQVAQIRQSALDRRAAMQQQADEMAVRAQMEQARLTENVADRVARQEAQRGIQDLALQRLLQAGTRSDASQALRSGELDARLASQKFTENKFNTLSQKQQALDEAVRQALAGGGRITDAARGNPDILNTKAGELMFQLENRPMTFAESDYYAMNPDEDPRKRGKNAPISGGRTNVVREFNWDGGALKPIK